MEHKEIPHKPIHNNARILADLLRQGTEPFRTCFGIDLVVRPILDSRKIKDDRMDSYDKQQFAIECRFVFGVDPVKTYLEFVEGYKEEKPLIIHLLERLKAERKLLEHQILVSRTNTADIEKIYYYLKNLRSVPFDFLGRARKLLRRAYSSSHTRTYWENRAD